MELIILYTNVGVVPIMDYGASVWGFNDFTSDHWGNTAQGLMRCILRANKYAPTHALYGGLGWVMPSYRRWTSMIQLWNRFVQKSSNRLAKKVFLWDKYLCMTNWSSEIGEICEEFSFEHEFNNL